MLDHLHRFCLTSEHKSVVEWRYVVNAVAEGNR